MIIMDFIYACRKLFIPNVTAFLMLQKSTLMHSGLFFGLCTSTVVRVHTSVGILLKKAGTSMGFEHIFSNFDLFWLLCCGGFTAIQQRDVRSKILDKCAMHVLKSNHVAKMKQVVKIIKLLFTFNLRKKNLCAAHIRYSDFWKNIKRQIDHNIELQVFRKSWCFNYWCKYKSACVYVRWPLWNKVSVLHALSLK